MSQTSHVPELDSLRSQVADLARELAERDQTMHAQTQRLAHTLQNLQEQSHLLRTIIEGTAADTGDEFFASLVTHLTSALNVQYAVIGEVVGEQAKTLRTLAVSVGGALVDNFEYALEHAPCGTGLAQPFWCFEHGIQAQFPHFPHLATLGVDSHCGVSLRTKTGVVVGLLIVMDTKPLRNSEHLKSLMEVFASRAAAELQRYRAEVAQRKSEETRRESDERFRAFLDHAPHLAFVKGTDGRYLYTNRRFDEVFRIPTQGALGKTDAELFPPEQAAQFSAHDRQVLETGTALECEEVAGHADGAHTSIVVKFPLRDASGHLYAVGGIATDITDRKRAEEALAEQGRHLVTAQAIAHVGSWDWDLDSGDVTWSDEQYRIFGYAPGAIHITYDTFLTALHPDDHDRVLCSVNEALLGRKPFDVEYRIVRPTGEVRIIHGRAEIHRDATGHPMKMDGTVLDITEQKQAEEALRASEERWHLAVQGSHDGIWDWNIRTGDIFFSTRWKAMRGYIDDELADSLDEWRSRIHPDDMDRVLGAVDAYLAKQRPDFCEEYRVQRKDGSYMWVLDRGIALWDPDGKPARMAGSETDITERKRAEQALVRSRDLLNSFVEHTPAAVAMLDKELRYVAVSRRWLEDYRLGNECILGRSHYDVFPEIRDMNEWQEIHRRCLHGAVERRDKDPFLRQDGRVDWLRWEVRPWHDESGQIGGIVIFTEVITARMQAEEALRESEQRFSEFMRHLPGVAFIKDADGRHTYVNQTFERLFGLTRDSWYLRTNQDLFPPDVAACFSENDRLALREDRPIQIVEEIFHDDGVHDWLVNKFPIHHGKQGAISLGGIAIDITERKRAEEALQRSERQLRAVLDALPVGVWFTDAHGQVLYGNPIGHRIWSRAARVGLPEQHSGKLWWETLGGTELPHRWAIGTVMSHGQAILNETIELETNGGTRMTVRNSAVPVRSDEGTILGAIVLNEDITERVAAEEALRQHHGLLTAIMNAATDIIFVKDREGHYLHMNPAGARALGMPVEEVVGWSDYAVWPSDLAASCRAADQRVLLTGDTVTVEEVSTLGGKRTVYLTTKAPYRDAAGAIIGIIGVSRDITERKQAEEALRNSEARLREAQRIAHIGSWELDLTENRLTWSDEIYRIFEIDPQRFGASYEAFLALVHPHDRDLVHRAYQQSLAIRQAYNVVHRLLMPDGRIKFVREQCETTYDQEDRPIRSLGTVQDITEQKRAEEALRHREQDLRQAIEERERISQDLHDGILQSLYAVGLGLESCKPLITQRKHNDAFATVGQAIGQLNQVMAEVRNFIAGLESEVLQGGNFETAVRTVINTVTQSYPLDRRLHIEQEALPYIPMDRALQLLNILREALSNIVRHAQASRISVSIRRLRRTIRLRIHDNGVGFDFKAATGTGHGLLNMAARAKKIGTEFELHSAPGEGTTIILDLPKEEVYAYR